MNWLVLIRESFSMKEMEVAPEFYFYWFPNIKIEAFLGMICIISFMNKGLDRKFGT